MYRGINETFQILKFNFKGKYRDFDADDFANDFFNSDLVKEHIRMADKTEMKKIEALSNISTNKLSTNILSMSFFDRFKQSPIIAEDGSIRSCMDEYYENVQCQDLLREYLCNSESENADLYSEEEKKEFIYHLFSWLVIGGSLCQVDDKWNSYLEMTKKIYKDLLRVHKNPETKEISVASVVLQVNSEGLFISEELNNRCYLIVDPSKNTVVWFYFSFIPYF